MGTSELYPHFVVVHGHKVDENDVSRYRVV
jgi:hypothetical protein